MKLKAPWTDKQVAALNKWQQLGHVHEFTCPMEHQGRRDRVLVATAAGWHCLNCDYAQDWAHDFMADETRHPKPPFAKEAT